MVPDHAGLLLHQPELMLFIQKELYVIGRKQKTFHLCALQPPGKIWIESTQLDNTSHTDASTHKEV